MSNDRERLRQAEEWWTTGLIDIEPGEIRMRGYAIEDLTGRVGLVGMIWLLLRGELPEKGRAELLEAALVAGVDHGPHAPSIAIARMAVSCGVGLNNAVGSAVNVLGDIHGGAGQQCMELYADAARLLDGGAPLAAAVAEAMDRGIEREGPIIPGFGHRFHPLDPRAPRLLGLVDRAVVNGLVAGRFAAIGRAVEAELAARKGRLLPMNIDGATAVVFSELGFAPPLGRGLFLLSRSVGILAHAWEQQSEGRRIKGPMPKSIPFTYTGPPPRPVPEPKD